MQSDLIDTTEIKDSAYNIDHGFRELADISNLKIPEREAKIFISICNI